MTELSPHFIWAEVTRSQTAIARGLSNEVPEELRPNIHRTAALMEEVRTLMGGPIRVTSWYRSPALNTAIGGSKTSVHPKGLAVDWQPTTMDLEDAFSLVEASAIVFDQLILEQTRDGARWIHIGLCEGTPRREVLRAAGARLGGTMTFARVALG